MKKPMKHTGLTTIVLALSSLAGPFTAHVGAQSYGNGGYSSLESQAVRESQNVGAVLGGIGGAALGAGLAYASGNRSYSTLAVAGLAGGTVGAAGGSKKGREVGIKQVNKTRHSFVERSRAEARLRSAKQYNAKLTDYNQSLRNRIAQLKAGKSKIGTKSAIAQAKRKQSDAVKQASSLESYANKLPASEAAPVRAAAQEISSEASETGSLLAELSKIERTIY